MLKCGMSYDYIDLRGLSCGETDKVTDWYGATYDWTAVCGLTRSGSRLLGNRSIAQSKALEL